MRITSLVVAVVAGLAIAVTGCGGTIESEQGPEAVLADEQVSEQSASQQEVTPLAICPLKWACDGNGKYYSTQSACNTACSPYGYECYRDYACNGTCVCP